PDQDRLPADPFRRHPAGARPQPPGPGPGRGLRCEGGTGKPARHLLHPVGRCSDVRTNAAPGCRRRTGRPVPGVAGRARVTYRAFGAIGSKRIPDRFEKDTGESVGKGYRDRFEKEQVFQEYFGVAFGSLSLASLVESEAIRDWLKQVEKQIENADYLEAL